MPFEVLVEPEAFARLSGIPDAMIDEIGMQINVLRDDPLTRGRKAVFPFPPIGHIYDFSFDHDSDRYYFTIFFLFGPEDNQLSITDAIMRPKFNGAT